jgi:hypothetical protein
MSRDTTTSREAINAPDDLREWIQDPGSIKTGRTDAHSS